jgi:hypothetical protein
LEKWKLFDQSLGEARDQVFWVNGELGIENMFEEACFEIENRKL